MNTGEQVRNAGSCAASDDQRSLAELYQQYFTPQAPVPALDQSSLLTIYDEEATTYVTQSSRPSEVHTVSRA